MWSRASNKRSFSPSLVKPDVILLGTTLALITIGTVMIYSSSSVVALYEHGDGEFFVKKQLFFLLLGMVGMTLLSKIHYSLWRIMAYPAVALSLLLLLVLLIPGLGVRSGGATRWLNLGFITFQVIEPIKLGMVVFLSHYLTVHCKRLDKFGQGFIVPLAVTAVLAGLTLFQPDYGSVVILAGITGAMLLLAGGRIKYLLVLAAIIIPTLAALLFLKGYRVERFTSFLNPWADPLNSGFQIIQSFISFGSGGAIGVGLGEGRQKLFFLPEAHTDFILAIIAEEGGLLGVLVVIMLYSVLIYRGFAIAYRTSDFFGYLLAAGITLLIASAVVVNTMGVMGLIPLKGMALPFLSYGGTSLIVSMAMIGILLNISTQGNR